MKTDIFKINGDDKSFQILIQFFFVAKRNGYKIDANQELIAVGELNKFLFFMESTYHSSWNGKTRTAD